jgi:hypothetical protein
MSRLKPGRLTLDDAETIALQALGFLADDASRVSRFLALTGSDPAQLRADAKNREFQAATLEYMLTDESLLLAFCQESGIDPAIVGPAHALLGGYGQD